MNDKDTRTSAYQTKPQAVEVDVEFGRYMFEAGIDVLNEAIAFDCSVNVDMAYEDAIETYKQSKQEGNE